MSILRTESLTKTFGHTHALADLNLELPEGAIYALVGVNGAGKTTAIKTIMNILTPTRGRPVVLDCDSRHLGPPQFARIGYVSENLELPLWMTLAAWLDYLEPFYPTWDRAWAAALVSELALPLERKLGHYSRGMRMKAALAGALAFRPRLIVLDEPFTGLDALMRDQLIEALLGRFEGATVLISSHDLAEVESFASHVGYIETGRLVFSEEMPVLAARFREIEVTLGEAAALPPAWPPDWMNAKVQAHALRFVHPHFDAATVGTEIRAAVPSAREIEITPMPLRAIFVALARAAAASGRQS